jgi:hypothetical protein
VKRCPTCKRTFDDDTLSFCLEDGTPLVREAGPRADSQETLVSPSPSVPAPGSEMRTTQPYSQLPGTPAINAARINVPVIPRTQRRIWPWIVAILAILLVMIGAVAMVIVIPSMLRATNNDNRAKPTPTRSVSTSTPTPEETASASPAATEDDVPDDEDEVKSQLTKIEEEWTEANVKGDKEALERILADDYVGGPTSHTKREYIDKLTPDSSIKSWELQDLTVDQDGDRATVHGTIRNETDKGTEVYNFTDKFVWRDHRWQAVASQATSVK